MIFGLLQVWSIAAGFILGVGFTLRSALDLFVLLTCAALATSRSRPFHIASLTVVWIAYIASAVLEVRA
ncbi:MAG: hypothetical protein GQ551_06660 [Myxococcales bacterium]|nr:hypothetical protein [Myxococcales bacterium]